VVTTQDQPLINKLQYTCKHHKGA